MFICLFVILGVLSVGCGNPESRKSPDDPQDDPRVPADRPSSLGDGSGVDAQPGAHEDGSQTNRPQVPEEKQPDGNGGMVSSGGELYFEEQNPWFLEEVSLRQPVRNATNATNKDVDWRLPYAGESVPIRYCIVHDASAFPGNEDLYDDAIQSAAKDLKTTLDELEIRYLGQAGLNRRKVLGFDSNKDSHLPKHAFGKRLMTISTTFSRTSCSEAELTFNFGRLTRSVQAALRGRARFTAAFANVDFTTSQYWQTGRARGEIFLTPQFDGSTEERSLWESGDLATNLHNALLHELGHVMGFRHDSSSFMANHVPVAAALGWLKRKASSYPYAFQNSMARFTSRTRVPRKLCGRVGDNSWRYANFKYLIGKPAVYFYFKPPRFFLVAQKMCLQMVKAADGKKSKLQFTFRGPLGYSRSQYGKEFALLQKKIDLHVDESAREWSHVTTIAITETEVDFRFRRAIKGFFDGNKTLTKRIEGFDTKIRDYKHIFAYLLGENDYEISGKGQILGKKMQVIMRPVGSGRFHFNLIDKIGRKVMVLEGNDSDWYFDPEWSWRQFHIGPMNIDAILEEIFTVRGNFG